MTNVVLYSYFRSSASYRVRIALYLKGIPFEYRAVHLLNNGGEQHKPAYRELNPSRQVPTLIHDEKVIGQSVAIIEYLEDLFPTPKLFPHNPYEKALVRQFCEIINCTQPMQNVGTTQYLDQAFATGESQRQAWMDHWLSRGFEALEQMLQKTAGTYSFGESVTAADCFLVPQVFAGKRFNIDLTKYPILTRLDKTLNELDAFKKAHPSKQPDTPV